MKREIECAWCGCKSFKETGGINRARRIGAPLFCNRVCAGLHRRLNKSDATRKLEKKAYDESYRRANRASLKAKKADYHKRTYDPLAAAEERKKNAAQHAEYCRQPKYRAYKNAYDQRRRDAAYGPFDESFRLLLRIEDELLSRASRYEIDLAKGALCKSQKRKRDYVQTIRC